MMGVALRRSALVLLLALLAEDEGAAVDVLKSIGVAPAAVREQLLWMLETEA